MIARPKGKTRHAVALGAGIAAWMVFSGGVAWAATPRQPTLYVSPHASTTAAGTSCATATYDSIQQALDAAPPGAAVVVCPGAYDEAVSVLKPVVLEGEQATVDAEGHDVGITVVASGATVEGMTVTGATGEGILVVGRPGQPVEDVTVRHNVVVGNDLGNPTGAPISNSSYRECNATGPIPGDCGEGIHLMVASHSSVLDNEVVGNAGGILLTDEFGPTYDNVISGNVVVGNLLDCGITLAGHSPAAMRHGVIAPEQGGVYGNLVRRNVVIQNGTIGQGGGILLATGVPGGAVYDNRVVDNIVHGNGLAGVTVHSHTPGEYLNGNVVSGNIIGVNNLDGDTDFAPHVDKATTGITVATVGTLTITVHGNTIAGDAVGIWTTGPVRLTGLSSNVFLHVGTRALHN
jgi:nitrous oxidase accessory protein NosD